MSVADIVERLLIVLATFAVAVTVHAAEVNPHASSGEQPYWVEQVVEGLRFPSSIVWLPNGDALVLEREGGLRLISQDKLDPMPISGVPPSFQTAFNGLKDIALDPDYRSNHTLYLLISEGTLQQHHAAVYRARYAQHRLEEVERIFRAKGEVTTIDSSATRMLLLSDGTLLLHVPEVDKHSAQQLDNHLGKILRINRDGSVPKNNPFVHTPGALPEIWSYGHRAVLGLYEDTENGEILGVESGERGGDELNVLKSGGNFGWAKASWSFNYSDGAVAPIQASPGLEDPLLVWTPSVTPAGITRYRGQVYPLWNGDYFIGNLSGKAVERVRLHGHRVVLQEKLLLDLEERIRDVKVGQDGYLYVLTDHSSGRLLRVRPGKPRANQRVRVAHKIAPAVRSRATGPLREQDLQPDDRVHGEQIFLQRCAGCHRVGRAVSGGEIGPDLDGAYGRTMGTQPGFAYSAAMRHAQQVWDAAALDRFLADPISVVSGTNMAAAPVIDATERRQIIGFLKQPSEK